MSTPNKLLACSVWLVAISFIPPIDEGSWMLLGVAWIYYLVSRITPDDRT